MFSLKYHLVWRPKCRRPVLVGPVEDRLKALLREKAAVLNAGIESLEVMPDHVHLFVSAPPTDAIQHLVTQLKGYTSRMLRQEFPFLRSRLPARWSRSYYAGTVGYVSVATVRRYIESQKGRWMRKTFEYRLYPTRAQADAMTATLRTHCRLYNAALEHRRTAYRVAGVSVTYGQQSAELRAIRQEDPFVARTNFSSCQATLRRLDRSFRAFFRRIKAGEKAGYPRFKPAHRFRTVEFPSVGDGCAVSEAQQRVYFQHVGRVKVNLHRPLEGTPKTLSFTRKADGWYLLVSCDLGDVAVKPSQGPPVGIDLGLISFVATSDGEIVEAPKFYRQAQQKLRRARRQLSRCKRGSNRRKKAVQRLARQHQHVANARKDFHHKLARALVTRHGLIAVEALNIRGIARSRLATSTLDAGWAQFLAILTHKAESAGVQVVAVDPRFTSQTCHACGSLIPKGLSVRLHRCPDCGYTADRDVNAAKNVLRLGLSRQARTPTLVEVA